MLRRGDEHSATVLARRGRDAIGVEMLRWKIVEPVSDIALVKRHRATLSVFEE